MSDTTTDRQLTFGEKYVGITFNPGQLPEVFDVKEKAAELIDLSEQIRTTWPAENLSVGDMKKQEWVDAAQIKILEAQMLLVKAVTFQYTEM